MSNASSTYYSPEVTDALYKYTVYCIVTVNLGILMPTISSWNSPVGYLPIPCISGQLFSWVSSKGKGEWNSEIHFVQGGNPGTCAQRPGREEWVSLGAVPWYVKVHLSLLKCQKSWQHVFFCILGGWLRTKFTKYHDVVTKHFFAGSSLDRAAAPCGGHSCSFAFKGSFDWFHYVTLHHSFFVGSQFLGRCMTWTMKNVLHHQPIMIEYVLVRVNRPLHRCSSVALKFYVTVAPGSSDSRRSLGAKPYPTRGSPGKALSFR